MKYLSIEQWMICQDWYPTEGNIYQFHRDGNNNSELPHHLTHTKRRINKQINSASIGKNGMISQEKKWKIEK